MNNLGLDPQRWFCFYRGYIYANRPLDVHTRINNKVIIDKLIATKETL